MNDAERPAPPAPSDRRPPLGGPGPAAPPPGPANAQGTPADGDVAKFRTLLRWFLGALFAAFVTSTLLLPWKVLGLACAVTALVLGIIALTAAVRRRLPPLVRLTLVVGLAAAAFLTIGTAAAVALWPLTERYEDCRATALTLQAQQECEEELRNLDGLLPSN